jgi:hypothetical protein
VEELEEGSSAAAAMTPGKGGGGGGSIVSDISGSVGSASKSRNFSVFIFLTGWTSGATYGEGAEVAEDVDDNIVGVKLNIVEG